MADFSLPSRALLQQQADWLAPARARLLRRVQVARRGPVLDLACGYGAVTGELRRRSGGPVVALDRSLSALGEAAAAVERARFVCADAHRLPFRDGAFQLVYSQLALVWLDPDEVAREVYRVLRRGGVWIALEPDYGGMIEYPPEIAMRGIWLRAIARAGGDPTVGRKLPGILATAGFDVRIDLLERVEPPSPARFGFLRELPLNETELRLLDRIEAMERSTDGGSFVHLPVLLATALRQSD